MLSSERPLIQGASPGAALLVQTLPMGHVPFQDEGDRTWARPSARDHRGFVFVPAGRMLTWTHSLSVEQFYTFRQRSRGNVQHGQDENERNSHATGED